MVKVKHFRATGESAVRPDKEMTERNVVVVVMKHPTENKYLCVRKKKFDWIDFVMGGIEGAETPVEAGERELIEETGYVNYEILGVLSDVYTDEFYAAHKDVNRKITVHTVYGKLKSLEQQERDRAEVDEADVVWIEADDLMEKLHTDGHRWDWERVRELGI